MIIARYLIREILQTLVAVTVILLFIFSCNEFVRYLSYVADGKYPAWVLANIVLLQIPILLGLLLPLGLYLGVLLGYGRLYADSEMTVLFACGFTRAHLIKITLFFAVCVMVVVAMLTIWVQPIMTLRSRQLLSDATTSGALQTVSSGRFQSINNGRRVFYVESISNDKKKLGNVFVAQRMRADAKLGDDKPQPNNAKAEEAWGVLYASGGYQYNAPDGNRYIVMTDGRLYKGFPGLRNFEIAQYSAYGIRTTTIPDTGWTTSVDTLPTTKLAVLANKNSAFMAELQWRLSAPLSVILLAIVALPLSRLNPRQGKFARILPAVLLYIIYANLMFVGRSWLTEGKTPVWLGLWWIHLLFLVLSVFIIKASGMLQWLFSAGRRAS